MIKFNVPEMWDDPYFFLMPAFLYSAISMEKHLGKGEPVEVVLDSSQRLDRQATKLYGQLQELPQFAGRLVNVWFRDENQFLPLQAADLLAWQVRRAFSSSQGFKRPRFRKAIECPQRNMFPVILERKDLERYPADMEANARRYFDRPLALALQKPSIGRSRSLRNNYLKTKLLCPFCQ